MKNLGISITLQLGGYGLTHHREKSGKQKLMVMVVTVLV